ncbi:MAG: hypothetical protein K0R57_2488 [Paenibacillaceae bacterium]|jgi:subtilisin family serine protease|nr:hypothetical protein [Paenibacillaceae bacterium]
MKKLITFAIVLIMAVTACGEKEVVSCGAEKDGIVRVAIIDTGISTVAIASEQLLPGYNYVTNTTDIDDSIGHGTAVASVLLGSKAAGVTGVAPNARVIPLVVKSRGKDGKIAAIDPAALALVIRDAVDTYHADVINISIGVAPGTEELRAAIEYAERKRVLIVASVGNGDINGEVLYPAAYPGVIGVGSVDKDNRVSSFSQKSAAVMIVAPGEDYWMASRTGKPYGAKGTSYATPFVSGAIALLLEAKPELTPVEIREILYESALDLYNAGHDEASGYGALQIGKALELAAK